MIDASREKFLQRVLELVADRFPLVKIDRTAHPFALNINGHAASLENLYRMSQLQPQDVQRHVERWMVELLRASEGAPDDEGDFSQFEARILPMVVPEAAQAAGMAVHQPLLGGLSVAYAIDHDRTISYISPKRLQQWKIDVDQLHETALRNLTERSEAMQASAAQDENENVFLIIFQKMDGYDASRVLLPNLHERLREHLGSPFVAAIPNRDILLCFRNDDQTVSRLKPQIETDYSQMPHQITDRLLLVTADGLAIRGKW